MGLCMATSCKVSVSSTAGKASVLFIWITSYMEAIQSALHKRNKRNKAGWCFFKLGAVFHYVQSHQVQKCWRYFDKKKVEICDVNSVPSVKMQVPKNTLL